jgi:uncharacterized protein (DUF1800 family)
MATAITVTASAATDYNNDGFCDVWQQKYNGFALVTTNDEDGDGLNNQLESLAGTDPRNSADVLKLGPMSINGTTIVHSFIAERGKRYQMVSAATANAPTWTPVAGSAKVSAMDHATDSISITRPAGTLMYYKIEVSDADTDADGVSDWAEYQTGTNPALATTTTNASSGTASDGATLQSIFSLTSTIPSGWNYALEKTSRVGKWSLTRTSGTMQLTLPYSTAGNTSAARGSASASDFSLKRGSDNAAISGGTFVIPAGVTTMEVHITATQDPGGPNTYQEVPETLVMRSHVPGLTSAVHLTSTFTLFEANSSTSNNRLYIAYLGREGSAITNASGVATITLRGNNDIGWVDSTFSSLTSEQSAAHLHLGGPAVIGGPVVLGLPNGQLNDHRWDVRSAATITTDQQMLEKLMSGEIYINVHTGTYSGGEIRGNFTLVNGSVNPPPAPAAPPAYGSTSFPNLAAGGVNNNPALDRDIARLLTQATFGPTDDAITAVKAKITAASNDMLAGYTAWISDQMNATLSPTPSLLQLHQAADIEEFILRGNLPITVGNDPQFAYVPSGTSATGQPPQGWNNTTRVWSPGSTIYSNNFPRSENRRREWWTLVLQSKDQLRQRMAFALSEIVVISDNDTTVQTYNYGLSNYWDMLAAGAFGKYRTLLEQVTYSPVMGIYLSHLKNQKSNGSISPDENFAREIMQLFSVGLIMRHQDGSLRLDSTGAPIFTYDQTDIRELARVLTGLSFGKYHPNVSSPTYPTASNQAVGALADNPSFTTGNGHRFWQGSWTNPMKMFSDFHDFDAKTLFAGKEGALSIPAKTASNANGDADIKAALDVLAGDPAQATYPAAAHDSTPVFISRLLIQRFTTSNPSAGYLYRVVQKYKDTNGNLGEVLKVILLDYEARSLALADTTVGHGKAKEPILHHAAMLRALKAATRVPLSTLNTMPMTGFTTATSPVTSAYPAAELSKFPAGAWRYRYFDTQSTLTQSPQRAPTVFNWFLPDYTVPGVLATAGLVAPELQVATDSNVISVVNSHYTHLFNPVSPTNTPANPPTNKILGRGLDAFPNMSIYRRVATNGTPTRITVPAYGVGTTGYFSANVFDDNGTTGNSASIYNYLDAAYLRLDDLIADYTFAYNTSLTAQYSPNPVPSTPGAAQITAAHDAAALAVLDEADLLFAAGYLKAKYGSLPIGDPSPQKHVIDALASGFIGSRATHTSSTSWNSNAVTRVRNILYLVLTAPEALVLK